MRAFVALVGLMAAVAQAADIPVRYTVNETTLRSAVNGTLLTFELFTNATCTAPAVYSASVPVQNVSVISRLKVFKPKGVTSAPPKTAELSTTLAGVSGSGNLHLRVTGTGIAAVGGACQAQAATLPTTVPSVVLEDANGVVIGPVASPENEVYLPLPDGGIAITPVGDNGVTGFAETMPFELLYESADCSGQPFDTFNLVLLQRGRYRAADETVYVTPTELTPIAYQSRLDVNRTTCDVPGEVSVPPDGCCVTPGGSQIVFAGPAILIPVGSYVRPFRYARR